MSPIKFVRIFVLISCGSLLVSTLKAELPTFEETELLGMFAFTQGENGRIKIDQAGEVVFNPLNKKGDIRPYIKVPFKVVVRKTSPDGKIKKLKIDTESLQSESGVTKKLRDVTITGKAGKGVTFEMRIRVRREKISLTGKITGVGKETGGELSLHFQTRMRHFYGMLLQRLKGDQKKFDDIVGEDWFEMRRLDKKKVQRDLTDVWSENTAVEVNGPGGSKIKVQAPLVGEKDKRILVFEAKGPSNYTIHKTKAGPIHEGYMLEWSFDQEKDQDGEALLTFEVEEL